MEEGDQKFKVTLIASLITNLLHKTHTTVNKHHINPVFWWSDILAFCFPWGH